MLIAQDARTWLLDEPISALDIAHQVEIMTLVHRLSREHGLSVVVVLHDVNIAARYCDEILALHSGRLIARGTPLDIMTAETLERIYGIPVGVLPHPATALPLSYVQVSHGRPQALRTRLSNIIAIPARWPSGPHSSRHKPSHQ